MATTAQRKAVTEQTSEDRQDQDGFSPFEQGVIRGEPFCVCGRIVSLCDGSRLACRATRAYAPSAA